MYDVDERDRVVALKGVPQCSTGAPLPHVLANERELLLGYVTSEPNVAAKIGRSAIEPSPNKGIAIIRFENPLAHFFGPPNDEAFLGHPLATRGLEPYGAFEIIDSSWIRKLEHMNSVHPSHDQILFLKSWRHFAFTFHDSTFECVSEIYAIEGLIGSIRNALEQMCEILSAD